MVKFTPFKMPGVLCENKAHVWLIRVKVTFGDIEYFELLSYSLGPHVSKSLSRPLQVLLSFVAEVC